MYAQNAYGHYTVTISIDSRNLSRLMLRKFSLAYFRKQPRPPAVGKRRLRNYVKLADGLCETYVWFGLWSVYDLRATDSACLAGDVLGIIRLTLDQLTYCFEVDTAVWTIFVCNIINVLYNLIV